MVMVAMQIEAVTAGYEDVGVRSTIAPMMEDITLYKAIHEFLEAFPYRNQILFSEIKAAATEKLLNTCKSLLHKMVFRHGTFKSDVSAHSSTFLSG